MIRKLTMAMVVSSMAFAVGCAGGEKKADEAPTETAPVEETAPAEEVAPAEEAPAPAVEEAPAEEAPPAEAAPEAGAEGGDTAQ